MELTRPEAYAKIIAIYLKNYENEKAYELSKEFVMKFPGELLSHILLSESAFRLGRFTEAKIEGRKALRYASSDSDMVFSSLIFASACFQLHDYLEGYQVLKDVSGRGQIAQVEEALVVFSMAMKSELEAVGHLRNLMGLNRERAVAIMRTYIHSLPEQTL